MGGTMEGLGVPIYGAYTAFMGSSNSTAYWTVNDYGEIDHACLHNAASNTARGVNYMEAVHLQVNITTATQGTDALWAGTFHDSGTCSGQIYAAEFWLQGASGASVGGGRVAAINLIVNHDSAYGQVDAATSYINFTAVDALVPAFFTVTGETLDGSGGCFFTSDASVAYALRIYVANTAYNIMVSAAT